MAMMEQYFLQLEFVTPAALQPNFHSKTTSGTVSQFDKLVDIMASFMFLVSAGHEHVGAVEAYVQDVSFCAFKWTPGRLMGTKQTATQQGLLMSFTSTPMPKLMGEDWTHLFLPRHGETLPGRQTPAESY